MGNSVAAVKRNAQQKTADIAKRMEENSLSQIDRENALKEIREIVESVKNNSQRLSSDIASKLENNNSPAISTERIAPVAGVFGGLGKETATLDPFEAALNMAIKNDGTIDTDEINVLNKLVLKDKEVAPRYHFTPRLILYPSFDFYYGNHLEVYFFEEDQPRVEKPKTNNQDLSAAYQIAAADGKITQEEIKLLKESITK